MYNVSRVAPNLPRYLGWLAETHTPLILLGFAWPLLAWWLHRPDAVPSCRHAGRCRCSWSAFTCPYLEFDHWSYTPIPCCPRSPCSGWCSEAPCGELGERDASCCLHWSLAVVLFELYAGWSKRCGRRARASSATLGLAACVGFFTPPDGGNFDAAAQRPNPAATPIASPIRWDVIPPRWLDRSIAYLQEHSTPAVSSPLKTRNGRAFIERFGQTSHYGRLDWPPDCLPLRHLPVRPGAGADVTPRSAR